MILLDTSSLVHFLRRKGEPRVKERVRGLLATGEAALCEIVIVELWMGVGSREDEQDITQLISLLDSLPINSAVWERARELAVHCRKNGTPVPSSDIVIAACAFVNKAAIDYEDHHFAILETHR
ncbi:MAG: PIN domain-containing protein [Opitutales bacterium]